MKNLSESIRYVLWTAVLLLVAMGYGCKKDNIEPEPDPDPVNVPTTVGVRLQVEKIECSQSYDPHGPGEVELYGFIRAFATYGSGYNVAIPPAHYEKRDTALLWYRDADQFVVLRTGDVININQSEYGYVDFYCDINKTTECTIHLFPFLLDWDDNNSDWRPDDGDIYIVKTDLNDNYTSWTMDKLLNPKDTINRISLGVFYDGAIRGEMVIHYSIRQLNPEAEVVFPAGRGPGMVYKEADHVIPDPPKGQRVEVYPPEFSNRLVVGQVLANAFGPMPMSVYDNGVKYSVYNLRPSFVSGGALDNPRFEIRNLDQTGVVGDEVWVGLVKNEALRDIYLEKPDREAIGDKTGEKTITQVPYLQMVKYWELFDSKSMAKGETKVVGKTKTKGISSTSGREFSVTASFGGSGIFDIFSFNLEIKNTFSSSYTYDVEEEYKVEQTFGPYDYPVRVNMWQEVHEFRIVDKNGKLFTDPNYEFRSMVVAKIPTENIYTEVQEFK